MNSISIIICTYNPEQAVFEKCLSAIQRLQKPDGTSLECTIVDNNSEEPVHSLPYVQAFLSKNPWAKIIVDKRPGQSFARAAGCRASKGEWIFFFDDDNEPAEDYILVLQQAAQEHQQVGLWGPGRIKVIYMAEADPWLYQNKQYFQERDYGKLLIDNNRQMQYFYPPGTGMIVKKEILDSWADKFDAGLYSMGGRTGSFMDSSDDLQILFTALDAGYSIGSIPNLSLNHLTPPRKSTFDYVKRLSFGISASGPKLTKEVMKNPADYKPTLPSKVKINLDVILFYCKYALIPESRKKSFLISYIHYFAGIIGTYRLMNHPLPKALLLFMKSFDLEKAGSSKLV